MTLPLRISEEAAAEMVEAARWYETHRAGLGTDFLDAVDDTVSRIAKAPRIGSSVPGISDPMIRRTPAGASPTTSYIWSFPIGSKSSLSRTIAADRGIG